MFSIILPVAGTHAPVTKLSYVQPPTFLHRGKRHPNAWSAPPQVKRPSRSVIDPLVDPTARPQELAPVLRASRS